MAVTPADLAKLQPAERMAFIVATAQLARGENPPINITAALLLTIERLITGPAPMLYQLPDEIIVQWCEVRAGDVVLVDDGLIVAEGVQVLQKPWGDGTTFTAVDISYRLENGHLVTSEHHGDRYTAVRRPARPLEALGAGPLLDPDCRDGKCGSCVGAPCEHECHQASG